MAPSHTMPVTAFAIRSALGELSLSGRALCVHSSLRTFGHVEGGADTVVSALLAEGCTVLVPTFSYGFGIAPPPGSRPAQNGWDYGKKVESPGAGRLFVSATNEVDADMGVVPAAVLARANRARGRHPLDSFAGLGPLADALVSGQTPLDVYAPLRALASVGGWIVLMGVGLERLTLLHAAEQRAGRRLFRRWANGLGGPEEVECGGCSEGFGSLEPALSSLARRARVGASPWVAYPAAETLDAAAAAIRADPEITRCGRSGCDGCADAVAGGPLCAAQLGS